MAKDFYSILGVNSSATEEDIKRAYRRLSKELHPDRNKGDKGAEQRYKEVNEAYETLKDPKKRKMYDQFGTTGGPGGAGFEGFRGFHGFNPEDFAGFSDIFESFFGGGSRGGQRRESHGNDIEVEVTVDFRDTVQGARHTVTLRRQQACEACNGSGAKTETRKVRCKKCGGTGQIVHSVQSFFGTIRQSAVCTECRGSGEVPEHPCPSCGGEGRKEEKTTVAVEIPAGIQDGQTLRLRGQGEAGRQGTAAGDLFVHVRVRPDPRFVREGDDIRSEFTLPALDAILGTEMEVETVHGPVALRIPEGTQPEQVFRLKGKGMPVLGSGRHGDHYVTVHIEIPHKLSRKEQVLLEEWRKILG